MRRRRSGTSGRIAALGALLAVFVGCNAILGIEERQLATDLAARDGGADGIATEEGGDAPIVCTTPGSKRCVGGALETCDATGIVRTESCPTHACAGDQCVPVVQVAGGLASACALLGNGTVECWGSNQYGQLGDDSTVDHANPTPIPGLTDVTAIAVGATHACALLASKAVRCWGRNVVGEVGDGTATQRTKPTDVSIGNVVQIVTGATHSCARRGDGTVTCWGDNTFGQLGDGTVNGHGDPANVPSLTGVVELGSNGVGYHACARFSSGSISCWGRNHSGQLGDGTTVDRLVPTPVPGLTGIIQLAMTAGHSCALKSDGTVSCWGDNADGDLGDNTGVRRLTPVAASGLSGVTQITAGAFHHCARLTSGEIRCWGRNADGQSGNETRRSFVAPQTVPNLVAAEVQAGASATYARLTDGSLVAFGVNINGELGDGTTSARFAPRTVVGVRNATEVAVGGSLSDQTFACAVHDGGAVSCWGNNDEGQLGDGTNASRSTPADVSGLAGTPPVKQVALGAGHGCALLADKTVRCWGGYGTSGAIGDGAGADRRAPVQVTGLTTVAQISSGLYHSCALLDDATVSCWGNNTQGAIGDGTTTARLAPVRVAGLTNVVQLACGGFHTCARRSDNAVLCWGDNGLGQLGDGTTISLRTSPTPVPGLTAVEIQASRIHNCARVGASSAVVCWGYNGGGNLGDGTFTDRNSPVPVQGVINAAALLLGAQSTCVADATGNGRCWGDNAFGQLGDGTTTPRELANATPSFSGIDKFARTGTGPNQACAVMLDKTVSCWGFEQDSGRSTPRPVQFK